MIEKWLLQHYTEMIRGGYRPNRKTIQQIIDSHLEALVKLEELTTVNRHLSGARCDLDCSYCRAGTEYGYLTGDDA